MESNGSSLFEGMDFVLSTEDQPGTAIEKSENESRRSPLDEDLFSGLSLASGMPAPEEDPLITTTISKTPLETNHASFENIMAAYGNTTDTTTVTNHGITPGTTQKKATSNSNGGGGRKKKRGVKIGYGRGDQVDDGTTGLVTESTPSETTDATKSPSDSLDVAEFEAILHDRRISVSGSEFSQAEGESEVGKDEKMDGTTGKDEKIDTMDGTTGKDEDVTTVDEVSSVVTTEVPGVTPRLGLDEPSETDVTGVTPRLGLDEPSELEVTTEVAGVTPRLGLDEPSEVVEDFDGVFYSSTMSIEEKLEGVKRITGKKLKNLDDQAGLASAERKIAAQGRRKAAEQLSAASLRRKELEDELESACEKEDFELADKLSDEVAEAQKVLDEMEGSFKEADMSYDRASSRLEEIVALQIGVQEEAAALLSKLEKDAIDSAEKLRIETDEAAEREIEVLDDEEKQVEIKRTQYMAQLRALEEAGAELRKVIAESNQPASEMKQVLVAERNELFEQLKELMEMVKAKQEEIEERDRHIEEIDAKMENVAGKFEDQRMNLESEAKNVNVLLEKLGEDSASLELARKGTTEKVLLATEDCEMLKYVASAAATESSTLREIVEKRRKATESTKSIKERKQVLMKQQEMLTDEAQGLKEEATAARASLQELSSRKVRLQQDITNTQQKIAYIDKRGPELEAEKKLAAAARNFKEAARLSAEAKTLLAEKDACTNEAAKNRLELLQLEHEMEAIVLGLEDVERMINIKEKEAARTCCERLRLVAAAARDERDTAIEVDDFEEAECLQAEADAADAEADELLRIHRFEDDASYVPDD